MQLRPYQQETVDALWRYFQTKHGNPLLVLPTAAGKSHVQAAFVSSVLDAFPSQRFLLLTHVKELVEQNAEKLERYLGPMKVGIYAAGLRRRELDFPVTVASVQSLVNRLEDLPPTDLVIIDECHLVPPKGEGRYRSVLSSLRALNPALKVIGMSATPYRLKSGYLHEGKGSIFTDIAHEVGVKPLIEAGYLSPLVSKAGRSEADLSTVRVRGGEFVASELEHVMNDEDLVERSLDEVEALCAERRKWILFCAGVKHARRVTNSLRRRGYSAELVTGKTSREEREATIRRFKNESLRALVNVNVLTTGFDATATDAVVLLRATQSPGLFAQMVGRGMRLHPGKSDCLVLDFGGNVARHGPVDAIHVRNRRGGGPPPMKVCPKCQELVYSSTRVCGGCGHEFEIDTEHRKPHEAEASELPILDRPVDANVSHVRYRIHRKDHKPPSLRVDYICGLQSYSEWVCLEHSGYAGRRAARWWAQRGKTPVPTTVDEALKRADELRVPALIRVRRDGKFWAVVGAKFAEAA